MGGPAQKGVKRVSKGRSKGGQKGCQKGVKRVSEGYLRTPFWPQGLTPFRPKEAYLPKVGAKRCQERSEKTPLGVFSDVRRVEIGSRDNNNNIII